jgi:hypothetical protein
VTADGVRIGRGLKRPRIPGGVSLTVDGKNPLLPGTVNPITLSLGLNGNISS